MNLEIFRALDGKIFEGSLEEETSLKVEDAKRLHAEGLSVRDIAQKIGVPKSTVSDYLKHPEMHHGVLGRRPYLDSAATSEFLAEIRDKTISHEPPNAHEAARIASGIISNPGHRILPTDKWARDFARHHSKDVVFGAPKKLESQRAAVDTPDVLVPWHEAIQEQVHPERVPDFLTFNMDEFKVDISDHHHARVFKPVGFINPSKSIPDNSSHGHITIGLCSSPDPVTCRSLKHLCILPLSNLPFDLESLTDTYIFAGNPPSGWINGKLFAGWAKHLINFIDQIRKAHNLEKSSPEARALLYVDADESRRNPEALDDLKSNNVDVVALVAKATTSTQPNDKGLIGSIKNKAAHLSRETERFDLTVKEAGKRRCNLLRCIAAAIKETYAVDERIKEAWANSSLFPFSIDHLYPSESQRLSPPIASKYLDAIRQHPGEKFRISGKVLTSDGVIEPLRAEKAASKRKGKEKKGKGEKSRRGGRKKRDPSSSEGEEVEERSNSGSSDIGEVTKKRKRKASPVTTAASRKRPRLSDEGRVHRSESQRHWKDDIDNLDIAEGRLTETQRKEKGKQKRHS